MWRRCGGSRLELFWVQVEKPRVDGGGAGPELLRGSQTLLITGRMFAEGLLSRAVM